MIAAGCAATLSLGVAQAGVISVQTSATEVAPGETFEVDVIFDAAMGEFLSTAEFDFEYDEELFRFVSAEPGDELVLEGDPDYIGSEDEPLVFEANQDGPGSLDVFASSYNSADFLAANQADSFSIVTFTFEALMMGTGQLSVAALDDFFADFFGEPIMVELGDASVTVEVVPLPGAAVFLLTGLAGLVARRRLG
jgi:hypothetical protein